MNYKILVNKDHGIDIDYIPYNLVKTDSFYKDNIYLEEVTYEHFKSLQQDALKMGYKIDIMSGYRDSKYQQKLFDDLVLEKGYNYAYKYVAKSGYSEHQTGLCLDFLVEKDGYCYKEHEIEDLEETKWIHNNCYKYGFIVRYPLNKEEITKYNYEAWHLRYVGADVANQIFRSGLCLEEVL